LSNVLPNFTYKTLATHLTKYIILQKIHYFT